jgi:hypothetical protein
MKKITLMRLFVAIFFFIALVGAAPKSDDALSKKIAQKGISFSVPQDFPPEIWRGDKNSGAVIFKEEIDNRKLRQFFKIAYAAQEPDFRNEAPYGRLPDGEYAYGNKRLLDAALAVNTHKGVLSTIDLDITRDCGAVDKTGLLVYEFFCPQSGRHFLVCALFLPEYEFLRILETLKCH